MAYKKLAETYGQRRKINIGLTNNYINQFALISTISNDKNILNNGDRVLEIGTGWTPWLATMITFFKDVEVYLFDVIDNRRLSLYKLYINQLNEKIKNNEIVMNNSTIVKKKIDFLARKISNIDNWSSIYELLGFKYIISKSGSYDSFRNNSFDLVISWDVMEHVKPHMIQYLTESIYRILKPGGFTINTIDYSDHYYYYDKNTSIKQYLKYSDKIWKLFFENEVQYFNRIQCSEWLKHFGKSNFVLQKCVNIDSKNINTLTLAKKYRKYSKRDLNCTSATLYHYKSFK
jgi:cyclopropane fatty-acyl-phospholipid synthase-like methyltransferase